MAQDQAAKVGDLVSDARSGLAELLDFDGVKPEQWFLRLTGERGNRGWRTLTADPGGFDAQVRELTAQRTAPITDMVLAFVGTIDWRGTKQFMAYMQYFRRGYSVGLLCGSHLVRRGQKIQSTGGFLIMGSCQNLWLQ
jgi:hypothetical protein